MASSRTELDFRPWRDPQALSGSARVDVCIIGGGFTGLWTAIRLKEADPALAVAIVEADQCGSGASGRNSGAIGTWWAKLPTLARLLGAADAVRVLRASVAAVQDIHAFIDDNDIACDGSCQAWVEGRDQGANR